MDTQHLKQKEPADRRGKEGEEEEWKKLRWNKNE